jgi:ElaB/YqjD/DUF883 family membrane-anchored ribosome-binding protein
MATATGAAAAVEAIKRRLSPTVETLEDRAREARRVILQRRYAAEDAIAGATLQVRRHPLSAVALATGIGTLAGMLIGFSIGSRERRGESL